MTVEKQLVVSNFSHFPLPVRLNVCCCRFPVKGQRQETGLFKSTDSTFESQPEKMNQNLPNLPSGPLDVYRKKASFNWKEMATFLEGEEIIAFKVRYSILQHN